MAAAVSSQAAQPVVPAAQQAPVTVPARFGNVSLYVGDLDPSVNEAQLHDLFGKVAQVASLRVCRDQTRMHSLGYAYVNFTTAQDAANAKELLNFTPINGKPIRIMFSHRDPSIRKSGYANLFIKNLDKSIDNKALLDKFSSFGTVLSCKVAADASGQSKGYGFVQYDNEESSATAMAKLNGMLINDKKVDVKPYVRAQRSNTFQNIYVKNLPETTTDDEFKNLFGECGKKPIISAKVMRDDNGKSRCFGFVNFKDPENAVAAIDKFNGTTFNDKVLFVGKAQKKSERQAELRAKFEQERISRFEKLQFANLYLKNLDDSINNDEKLKELFSEFGTITSCKVMYDHQGVSKGSGFVAFSTPEEAEKALNEMNGKMIGRKPLYVAVAQRKEERKARLQARFAQIRAPGGMTPLPSAISGYHPGAPRFGPQQLYFGQGMPGLVPHQPAGYGFQQQIMPGMRPPNFIMPYHVQRQGQPRQRIGVRRGENFQQVQQQQQLMHRNSNQGLRYVGNARNGVETPMSLQRPVSPMMSLPFDGSGMPVTSSDSQHSAPVSMSTLASALASATPDNQRLMMGEQLYFLVKHIEPGLTAKVTGMLLEMDQTEVLHLIESPDALKDKVAEAMDVLCKGTSKTDVTDQLAALDLN